MRDPGRTRRWRRILAADERSLILAMDHGAVFGDGPPVAAQDVEPMVQAGVDAVLTTCGLAARLADVLASVGLIVRLDGGRTSLGEAHEGDISEQLFAVEEAARLGADGVAVMGYPGTADESRSLSRLAGVAARARALGMVVMAEVIPFGFGQDDRWSGDVVARGARIGAELGADLIKTVMPTDDDIARVAAACPVPIVVLGGRQKRRDEGVEALTRAVVDGGGAGLAMGRNLWGAADPARLIRQVSCIIHP